MKKTKRMTITLYNVNEKILYNPYSLEQEFHYGVQRYIKARAALEPTGTIIDMHIISQEPLDEDRFMAAVSSFVEQEKALLRKKEKETLRMLFGLLAFGSIFIVLSLTLMERFEVLKYSLLPVMGSLALSRATAILVIDIPTIRTQKLMLNAIEKNSRITFEYQSDTEVCQGQNSPKTE